MRVRPRVVVFSLLGLVVVGALLLLYSRELFGVDVIKNFFLQQLETSLRRKIEVDRIKLDQVRGSGGINQPARAVIQRVRRRIEQLEPGLHGVRVVPVYDRTGLIDETVAALMPLAQRRGSVIQAQVERVALLVVVHSHDIPACPRSR